MNDVDYSEAQWRKSRHSNANGSCVELATASANASGQARERIVAVRDTEDRSGPALAFCPSAWLAFTDAVRADRAVTE